MTAARNYHSLTFDGKNIIDLCSGPLTELMCYKGARTYTGVDICVQNSEPKEKDGILCDLKHVDLNCWSSILDLLDELKKDCIHVGIRLMMKKGPKMTVTRSFFRQKDR